MAARKRLAMKNSPPQANERYAGAERAKASREIHQQLIKCIREIMKDSLS
jgi:hypothetical protein